MQNTLYQVQLETRDAIYCFEVATNDYDAVEWAEAYLTENELDFGPFHVGGYCSIGYTNESGIVSYRRGG